jgi:chloramphenicol 3-O phosphotransferase
MSTVIVLIGTSSSGKSTIARELQLLLPQPYLTVGVDTLIAALPAVMPAVDPGLTLAADGTISVGSGFRRLEHAWLAGISAIARDGVGVILDEVFLGGVESQQRVRSALSGLSVLWVAVRCDVEIAVAREAGRPDRVPGMVRSQAQIVHEGVSYDLQVDTSHATARECAAEIAAAVGQIATPPPR